MSLLTSGSSPQVRGIWTERGVQLSITGIIPAGAGHFGSFIPCTIALPDHPRRCGAFAVEPLTLRSSGGSSPQMRGISHGVHVFATNHWIIPADAGHLKYSPRKRTDPWDHPRRCGAFLVITVLKVADLGSSPQMRGIFSRFRDARHRPGIIPADAGHFIFGYTFANPYGDHPRRCGAFSSALKEFLPKPGSSPQMRGIFGFLAGGSLVEGIIPADAGHFPYILVSYGWWGDHPRRCGAFP